MCAPVLHLHTSSACIAGALCHTLEAFDSIVLEFRKLFLCAELLFPFPLFPAVLFLPRSGAVSGAADKHLPALVQKQVSFLQLSASVRNPTQVSADLRFGLALRG